jgi:hypothetical protein
MTLIRVKAIRPETTYAPLEGNIAPGPPESAQERAARKAAQTTQIASNLAHGLLTAPDGPFEPQPGESGYMAPHERLLVYVEKARIEIERALPGYLQSAIGRLVAVERRVSEDPKAMHSNQVLGLLDGALRDLTGGEGADAR